MLIDEVDIIVTAGHGGAGKASFYPGKKAGPDGGDGGKGGDLYIEAITDIFALNQFSKTQKVKGEDGGMGGKKLKTGAGGEDLVIKLPIGSELLDKDSSEIIKLASTDDRILVAKGGIGGRGNGRLANSRNTTPLYAQRGMPGIERRFRIHLKLIADLGLIGLPNAGKSSLLNELTNSNVKVADYPFTTLEPNLGVMGSIILADIPGLIEGASSGRGLGIKFLKHIEKVKLLLHCISAESDNPDKDYRVVRKELTQFNPDMAKKEEIILLTKADTVSEKDLLKKQKILKKHGQVFSVSLLDDKYHPSHLPVFR